jgi:hypothetical protein
MDQTGVYGVTHCTKEVLQAFRCMRDELVIPADVRPFIMNRPAELMDDPKTRLNDLRDTDLLVVELSSAKELLFRGFYLQLHLTSQRFVRPRREPDGRIVRRPALRAWWRRLERNETDADDRASVIADNLLSPLEAAVIKELELRVQPPEEVRTDMQLIRQAYSGPILFVTHFDTPRQEADPRLDRRARHISAVRQMAAELGFRVYDPSADVLAYVAEEGELYAAITDRNHYTEAFVEERLAERMRAEALSAVAAKST